MARAEETRTRILDATLQLLRDGGRDAVSTRAVTSALDIQAPTIYRIFGDKQGLLDAVALHGFEAHLATWDGGDPDADPVESIRRGWDAHVDWGVRNPHLYAIAYGQAHPGTSSPAATAIDAILRTLVERAAAAGLLTTTVEAAVSMLRAVGTGVVLTLIALPADTPDTPGTPVTPVTDGSELSRRARDAALDSFLLASTPARPRRTATAMQLKTELATTSVLQPNERALLGDWLDRLAGADG